MTLTEDRPRLAPPPGYGELTPLSSELHGGLRFRAGADGAPPEALAVVPLLADEFAQAQIDHPILFSRNDPPAPAILTALEQAGAPPRRPWRPGVYRPLWLRRYPFALALESEGSERHVLCADLSAPHFVAATEADPPLFVDGAPGAVIESALGLCRRFEQAAERSRAICAELARLELMEDAAIDVTRGAGPAARVQGFRMVSEARLRALDDTALAGLARRGVVGLIAAHHFSLQRVAQFFGTPA